MGEEPLSYTEIQAWASLMGHRPLPWEVQLLRQIYAEIVTIRSKQSEASRMSQGKPKEIRMDDLDAIDAAFGAFG